jgi:DnaK suppressor protein
MTTATRATELKRILDERRRDVQDDIDRRVRGTRSGQASDVRDHIERSDTAAQEDLDLAIVEMRSETLTRIVHALARLDAGQYGRCLECAQEIAERRLRAMPFAVRCHACEARREQRHGRAHPSAHEAGRASAFSGEGMFAERAEP